MTTLVHGSAGGTALVQLAGVFMVGLALGSGCRHRQQNTGPTEPPQEGPDWNQPADDLGARQLAALVQECSMFDEGTAEWRACIEHHRQLLTPVDPSAGLPDHQRAWLLQRCSMYPEYGGGWTQCVQHHRTVLESSMSPAQDSPPPASAYAPPAAAPQPPPDRTFDDAIFDPSSGCLPYVAEGDGHWILRVYAGGASVLLEDHSVWIIHPLHRVDAMLWLPVSDIVVVDTDNLPPSYTLINTDDEERASACFVGYR